MRTTRSLLATILAGAALAALFTFLPGRGPVDAQVRNPNVPASACSVRVAESADPTLVRDCDEVEVTVTGVVSAPQELPLHVVFLIGKHLLMFDHLDEVKKAARDMVNALEFTEDTKVGVVTLSVQSKTEQELTNKRSTALSAINRIQLDQLLPTARQYDWMQEAEDLLADARDESTSPREIIILFSTGCPVGFERYCSAQKSSSSRVQSRDIEVIGVCKPDAGLPPLVPVLPDSHCNDIRSLSTRGSDYDLRQAARVQARLSEIEEEGKRVRPDLIALIERLAPGFEYVAGSGLPAPKASGSELRFEWSGVQPGQTVTASYRAKPLQLGLQPLREQTSEFYVEDSLERVSPAFLVPTRTLEVIPCEPPTPAASPSPTDPPTPSPTPRPSDTSTPPSSPTLSATATDPPTPTSEPGRVYLPMLWNKLCKRAVAHTDVVLVIDASSSMETRVGDTTRMEAAREAARRFVALLDLEGGDRAALVSFNAEARLLATLGQDRGALETAIQGIATAQGTRMDLALAAARDELEGSRADWASNHVVVLMTDGRPDGGSEQATLDAAQRFEIATLYAIGFGNEINATFLRALASRPETFLEAPGPEELSRVYEDIAGELPCPGGIVLGP